MKYAITYDNRFRHTKKIDEIILPFKGIGDLYEFIPTIAKKRQRVIVFAESLQALQDAVAPIQLLRTQGYNIALKIPMSIDEAVTIAKESGIPFFFNNFAYTVEDVYVQAESGVSDVYIVESLGFNLRAVKAIKDRYNIQIRVFPNIAQGATAPGDNIIPAYEKFWIRPEDTELYEEYVDVFELLGGDDNSRLSVVYEIYTGRQWLGDLKDLILDFDDNSIINTSLNPRFGASRLNCNKKCLEGRCNLCKEMVLLATMFDKVGIEVIKKRKREEIPEEKIQEVLDNLNKKAEELKNESRIDENSV